MSKNARIQSIYRYPVKGLSPEQLPSVALSSGRPLPNDRRYAIENGPSGFDPADPKYFPKSHFLMLMRDERLAALRTRFDDDSHVLTIQHNGAEAVRGNLETAEGRAAIEAFFKDYCAEELKGPPKSAGRRRPQLFRRGQKGRLDHQSGERRGARRSRRPAGRSACAFAATSMSPAGRPGASSNWSARHFAVGDARLNVTKVIQRCAAINVDPVTAARDLNLPQAMMRNLGHMDCGIYAEVVADGRIAAGDAIVESEPALI